ncbi:uncharacterized protein ARMOST_02439 [Armillaria ostoyae]|uniref:Uncharacterized protein n=1 Tax=Armillaria ostoyae TaxID=47428 RepID=A0A284QRQ3_ARMOS|nr:uncharacterized protein ARMOST_02439 [Armillaria ostoyae]
MHAQCRGHRLGFPHLCGLGLYDPCYFISITMTTMITEIVDVPLTILRYACSVAMVRVPGSLYVALCSSRSVAIAALFVISDASSVRGR